MEPLRPVVLVTLTGVALLLSGNRSARAQNISEIQIAPVTMTLAVGEQRTFLATAYDPRGNPVLTAALAWRSLNENVVRLESDPTTPNVVTVIAVGPGVAQIEARTGSVRSQSVIQVVAAQGPAPPDSVLPPSVTAAATPRVARLEPRVFGLNPTCRVGAVIGDNLIVTSYGAIRGADQLRVVLNDGRRVDDPAVATWDPALDVAILVASAAGTGLETGTDPASGDRVWALGQPGCSSTAPRALRVTEGTAGLQLDVPLQNGNVGAPLIDRNGNLVALALGGTRILPVSRVSPLVNRALANTGAGTTSSVSQVAARERHRYGALVLSSPVTGARAIVTPLDTWQWSELATESDLPFTFTGPEGRYRIDLLSGGTVRTTDTVELLPGQAVDHTLALPVVAQGQPPAGRQTPAPSQPTAGAGGGGGFPVAVLLVGLAAAGAGAALLAGGGGGGGGQSCQENPSQPKCRTMNEPGSITIRIPIP